MQNSTQLLTAALDHHKAGKFSEAASLYQDILSREPRQADALHLLGVLAHQLGKAELAVDLIERSIAINPGVTEYHNNLGNAFKALGRKSEAEKSYAIAIKLDPHNANAHVNLGILFEEHSRLEEAKTSYRHALRSAPKLVQARLSLGSITVVMGDGELGVKILERVIRSAPNHAPAHTALGNAYFRLNQIGLAKASYIRAIQLDSVAPDALFNLGNTYLSEKNYPAAIESYKQSIALQAVQADVHNNMGLAYSEVEQFEAAGQAFLRAIELDSSHVEAHLNFGRLLAKRKEHRKAIECFERVIELRPTFAKAFHSLGASRQALGELPAAVDAYRRALTLEPGYRDVASNLGSALVLQGSPEGITYLEQLVEQDPTSVEAHWNLSTALLLHGDYIRGWQEYEWRWRWNKFTSPNRGFKQPQWAGEQLEGATILLHAEQGFGDTLQFVRYVPLVAQRGGRIILEVQPALKSLLQYVPGVAACIAQGDPLPEFQFHCPLMSLPFVFGTTIETIPACPRGFFGGHGGKPLPRDASEHCLKIGLAWAGNPGHQNDALRSMSLAHFLPLIHVPAVSYVSLQKRLASAQGSNASWPISLPEPCSASNDFADTAAVMTNLDLVITVDTAIAHLAGAMGKPVWILNSHIPDWRWGLHAKTTPWYPTARLFRRSSSRGWEELMEEVASELIGFRDSIGTGSTRHLP